MSYTTYEYSGLKASGDGREVTLTVKNTGSRAGTEIAEVYAALPASAAEGYKRLVAFDRVDLAPGESKTVTLTIDPVMLSVFDVAKDDWTLPAGEYTITAGPSSHETPLTATLRIGQ